MYHLQALIRSVFQTREAWVLREMPPQARQALRDRDDMAPAIGTEWQAFFLLLSSHWSTHSFQGHLDTYEIGISHSL